MKADKKTIVRALTGQWKPQYLFQLEQDWNTYHHFMAQVRQCDERIDGLLAERVRATGGGFTTSRRAKKKLNKNDPDFPLDRYAFQLSDGQ